MVIIIFVTLAFKEIDQIAHQNETQRWIDSDETQKLLAFNSSH